jgi:hypothetical protein
VFYYSAQIFSIAGFSADSSMLQSAPGDDKPGVYDCCNVAD